MRVCVQYARTTPQQYQVIDVQGSGAGTRVWRNLPKKARPTASSVLDNTDGWIFSIAVQGLQVNGEDAYSVAPRAGGGVTVMAWSDQTSDQTGDPNDYPFRRGQVVQFPTQRADPALGGKINTAQQVTYYFDQTGPGFDYWSRLFAPVGTPIPGGGAVQWADYATFPFPAEVETKYGIWVTNQALYDATAAITPPLGPFDT